MAIKFTRNAETGAYLITDTTTGTTRTFESEMPFCLEALKLIAENAQRMEESIDRLYAMLVRRETPAPDIEVWPS
jgi:hypothetical protein